MERVLAEEIRDFDTSLDRLWARQDLIVLGTGALLCLRSLYRRAQRIGALGRFRYAVLRAEDYVLGTAEEEIRRSVRAAAALPGARVIVLYLSCLDILTRPDFADMEQRLSAETGCIVRCFFRGPLAKADGITHETAEDILAALPPAVGAVTARAPLPPPMSDVAGAADFLHADGAATVLVTPSGCRNALARMDLLPAHTDVYALIPKAEDYIFGMEDTAAEEVGALAAKGQHREIRVLTSPVPAFMAMAEEPVLAAAEAYGCHAEACSMDGFRDAYAGAAAVERAMAEEAASMWREQGRTVLLLGYSPLLCGDAAQLTQARADLAAAGYALTGLRDTGTAQPALIWLLSAAGITAATWLHEHCGIPIVRALPLGSVGWAAWQAELSACGVMLAPRAHRVEMSPVCTVTAAHSILIVADPIAVSAIRRLLISYGCPSPVCAAYAWSEETAALYRAAGTEGLHIVCTAEELRPLWEAADIVIADSALCSAMGDKALLPLPSGFLSGRDAAGPGSGVLGANFAARLEEFFGNLDSSKILN